MFLLGFGTAGRDLAANYEIRDLRPETVDSQAATHLELIPKSPDVLKQLNRMELWISERSQCPVRQKFHFPDGSYRTVTFSSLQLNPALPASTFDLPKSARRVRMN
jgi:outer membrane lipoprotein-sorting protein